VAEKFTINNTMQVDILAVLLRETTVCK